MPTKLSFDQCRNWKNYGSGIFGFRLSFPTTPDHPFASAEVVLKPGRDLRYKTESTTVICAFFLKKKTARSGSFSLRMDAVQLRVTNLIGMSARKSEPLHVNLRIPRQGRPF